MNYRKVSCVQKFRSFTVFYILSRQHTRKALTRLCSGIGRSASLFNFNKSRMYHHKQALILSYIPVSGKKIESLTM